MKLYPGHQHQWADAPAQRFPDELDQISWGRNPSNLVVCTVCGFEAPRNVAGLDGRPAQPDPQWVDVVARAICYGAAGEEWHPADDPEDWIQEARVIVDALLAHIAAQPEQETPA